MYTVIGGRKNRTLRVLWALEELGQDYELIDAAPASPEARTATGSGKVPALQIEGRTFTDSVAIMTYLADAHDALGFAAGTLDRLTLDGHMQFLVEELDILLWHAARHSFVLPEHLRVPDVKEGLKWEFERSLTRLEDRIVGPFLMGETFTIGDILATHCLNWGYVAKFPSPSVDLRAYAKMCRSRPAYTRALEGKA